MWINPQRTLCDADRMLSHFHPVGVCGNDKRATAMNQAQWSKRVPNKQAYRRAGGRRKVNGIRNLRTAMRRRIVAECFGHAIESALGTGLIDARYGLQAAIARQFGVNRSTVCKDVKAIMRELAKEQGAKSAL